MRDLERERTTSYRHQQFMCVLAERTNNMKYTITKLITIQVADKRPVLDSPSRVIEEIPMDVKKADKEHMLAFYLNARSYLLHMEIVSIGTLSASLVHPREVFGPAISKRAAGIIVVHNHPSGDCSPSPDDRDTTRRLCRAGEILGVPVLDHIIVAGQGVYSFREHGLIGA